MRRHRRYASGLRRSFTDDVGPNAVIGVLSRSTIIDLLANEDRMTPNIETIIKDHVTLSVRCLDRIYLQGYMPTPDPLPRPPSRGVRTI